MTFRACVHIRVYAPPDAFALPQALISPYPAGSPCSGGPGRRGLVRRGVGAGEVTVEPPCLFTDRVEGTRAMELFADDVTGPGGVWINPGGRFESASHRARRSKYASPVLLAKDRTLADFWIGGRP